MPCKADEPRRRTIPRARYPDMAIETGHLLRLAYGRPWRQTEGLLRSVAQRADVAESVLSGRRTAAEMARL